MSAPPLAMNGDEGLNSRDSSALIVPAELYVGTKVILCRRQQLHKVFGIPFFVMLVLFTFVPGMLLWFLNMDCPLCMWQSQISGPKSGGCPRLLSQHEAQYCMLQVSGLVLWCVGVAFGVAWLGFLRCLGCNGRFTKRHILVTL